MLGPDTAPGRPVGSEAGRADVQAAAVVRDTAPLLVLSAASLVEALPRVAERWTARTGVPVRFSFDATSRLAPQVEGGAPADLFVSADRAWLEWLRERDLVLEPAAEGFLRNELVVVVPARAGSVAASGEAAARIGGGEPGALDWSSFDRVALAGENVPAGRYARAALEATGVWPDVEDRIVRGGSVRGVLEWVALAEVDAGVVYRTDALGDPRVRIGFEFGSGGEVPAVEYAAAVVAPSGAPGRARELLGYLRGPEAAGLFREAGFSVPGDGPAPPPGPAGAEDPTSASGALSAALPSAWAAVRLSLLVGLLATLLGLVPAVGAGWLLARRSFPGKSLLSTVLLTPLVLPPVVTGFLLLMLLGRQGPLGLSVAFTPLAPILAALVVGFPLYVVAVRGAFEAVDPRFEEVSWTLGRPPGRTFFRIALPLALPGVAAGAVLAFARALGEFGATVVLAGNVEGSTRTIPLAVYTLLEAPGGRETMWILVGASVALSLVALLGYEALSRRQRRRLEDRHVR